MSGSSMTGTLTVRLPGPALRRVRARARALGVTPSELVRALLEKETGPIEGEPSALELTRRWIGVVKSADVVAGRSARAALMSWAPDRRG